MAKGQKKSNREAKEAKEIGGGEIEGRGHFGFQLDLGYLLPEGREAACLARLRRLADRTR